VSRTTTVSVALIFLSVAAGVTYEVHRRFESMASTMEALARKVDQATHVADAAAAGAREARAQAAEAAENAKAAAGARAQAEHLQQQAAAGQAQAETAAQQAREQAVAAHEQMAQMRRERDEELNHMQEVLSHIVQTRRTHNGMVMSLPDNTFTFDFDSAELKPTNRELLSRIAGILLVSKGYGLSVFGYTDDVGTADYNQKLSVRRASAVRDYLVQAGIEPGIVNVRGYGKTSPMMQGSTEAARAKNRRVEIALTDTTIKYDVSGAPR
jgi:outer membrane protein OmpA-like peptidoglycan-associated protein